LHAEFEGCISFADVVYMAAAAALEKRGFKDLQVSCYGVAVGCCSSVAALLRLLMSFIWW